jgi:hypothetical protein
MVSSYKAVYDGSGMEREEAAKVGVGLGDGEEGVGTGEVG